MFTLDDIFIWSGRAIGLLDLDAFFASVEQLDHPEWRGKPVIVGGSSQSRGVVATASYEARAYGVRSALPSFKAEELCPHAIWVSGRFSRYREVSDQVMDIIRDETPWIEQVSIDEAFFDISPSRTQEENPVVICKRIQTRVEELGISCSIGLAGTKALAKIASEQEKPRGLTCIYPGSESALLARTPCSALSGIGKSATQALDKLNIKTLQELGETPVEILRPIFGKRAELVQLRAQARDTEEIEVEHERKSVSQEMSFVKNLQNEEEIMAALKSLSSAVARRLRLLELEGAQVAIKIKYGYEKGHQAQVQLPHPTCQEELILQAASELTLKHWDRNRSIRLLGVRVSRFDKASQLYLNLDTAEMLNSDASSEHDSKRTKATKTGNTPLRVLDKKMPKDGFSSRDNIRNSNVQTTDKKESNFSQAKVEKLAFQPDLISGSTQGSSCYSKQQLPNKPDRVKSQTDLLARKQRLQKVSDAIKDKYGERSLMHGFEFAFDETLSSGGRKNPKDYD